MIAVCITTYNQQAYIAQAIESVIAQICDEPIRVYIGNDASSDKTNEICSLFSEQDNRIVYIRRKHNIGLIANTIDLYRRIMTDGCEYIAMLDGDDYWIDNLKLQKQVEFMREHLEYGFVHTAAYDDVQGQWIDNDFPDKPIGDISLQYNLNGAMHTNSTVLFRTNLLVESDLIELEKQHFRMLDYPLYGIFSQKTLFGYIHNYTAAWRKHDSVSQPRTVSDFFSYQFHYMRTWKWLNDRYNGNFHFYWSKAIQWYIWQVLYGMIHYFT